MTDEQTKVTIQALLDERKGYAMYDMPDRVKQVDEALKAIGYKAAAPAKRAEKF